MGNFTDNINALTTFKPYVAQQPVEAMVQVGMQKQNQYDQGLQKIQSQIDQVAGMDVVRDVDKMYLQSKLDTLGGNLRKVAAGDFSNYQLQNSVGGMVSSIAKDKNVQNAVSSTARYRKGIADMDAAIKEGKSSPSNEWDFQNQANQWLNNGDVKSSFSGSYSPYTNYKKNALDVIKSLTKDESITDDAFTLDSKGNLVIGDATVRKKLAGISPEKIQTALMATLTPADFKQMETDGRYNYSNASPQQFVNSINSSYSEKINFYNSQKEILRNAKTATTSNVEKSKLDEQIAALDKTMKRISSDNEAIMKQISEGNIEGVKAQLHTNNFLDNFSKAFSYTETSQTYETSPFAQMAMQRANKEQDWKKFLLGMEWDKEKFSLEYTQKERLAKDKAKSESGYGGLAQGVRQEDLPKVTLDKVINETNEGKNIIDQADNNFMKTQGNKDVEWFYTQKKAWEKSPGAVDPKIADHFNKTEEMRRKVDANISMATDIRKKAEDEFGTIDRFIPNEEGPIVWDDSTGNYINFSPKEIVDYNSKSERFIKYNTSAQGTKGQKFNVSFDEETARKELSPKEYKLFEAFKNNKTSEDKRLIKAIQDYGQRVNAPYKNTLDEINKYTEDEVAKRVLINQGVSYNIPTNTEIQKQSIGGVLSQFADLAETQEGGIANSPDFDVKIARALSIDPSTNYSITITDGSDYQDPMYEVSATGKEGNINFKITPEQKAQVFGNDFEAPAEVKAFAPYKSQITKMGGYTTSLTGGESNHENAFLSKIDFPSVQHYGVKANIEQPSPGKYSIRISAYDPTKGQWYDDLSYPRTQLVTESQIVPLLYRLNDAAIFELLTDKSPSGDDLKNIEKASKKPL